MTVHYSPTFSHGRLRDGRSYAVATTRCARVTGSHEDMFNPTIDQRATCPECRANMGLLDPELWRVHVMVDGRLVP